MTEEAKKKANEYMKSWRRQNKDKVKQYNENYWERKAQEGVKIEEKNQ